jgi:predicted nucleic acid-binding protein
MSRIYLDACTIIYLIEGGQPFQGEVKARIARLRTPADAVVLTSRLSRLECRTRPLREGNRRLLAGYESFFNPPDVVTAEISAAVIEKATDLRARYRFNTPDAIHLATAIVEHADVFLTGDNDLARCTDVKVEVLLP